MTVERKRYFQGPDTEAKDPKDRTNVVWFCETSIYHADTQNTSTAWVKKVEDDEVPQDDKDEAERLAAKAAKPAAPAKKKDDDDGKPKRSHR
jgi:hypothetical protein